MALRETESNAYAKFLGDKQRALWYVMVFSGMVAAYNNKIILNLTDQPLSSQCTTPLRIRAAKIRFAQ